MMTVHDELVIGHGAAGFGMPSPRRGQRRHPAGQKSVAGFPAVAARWSRA